MTGLDFVCMACAPCVLAIISYAEFEVLKKLVKRCQEHLNGSLYNYIRPSKYDKGELVGVGNSHLIPSVYVRAQMSALLFNTSSVNWKMFH